MPWAETPHERATRTYYGAHRLTPEDVAACETRGTRVSVGGGTGDT